MALHFFSAEFPFENQSLCFPAQHAFFPGEKHKETTGMYSKEHSDTVSYELHL